MQRCMKCGLLGTTLKHVSTCNGTTLLGDNTKMTYEGFCQRCGKKFESTHELGGDFVCTSCYINVPDDSHYHKGDIDPWAYIKANKLDFFEASVVKYITRWKYKNGLDDLRKAKVYIEELIAQNTTESPS